MSRGSGLSGFGRAQSIVPGTLQRVAAGWVDQEMVTIRKMAAAGATGEDIGQAVGKSTAAVISFIRRNKLVWNRMREDVGRHVIRSAGAMAAHEKMGHAKWVEEAAPLRQAGMSCPEISRKLGIPAATIYQYFKQHGIEPATRVHRKRMASRSKMLALIVRLHIEEVLSEGQVATATGLDRAEIRRLVAEASSERVAA